MAFRVRCDVCGFINYSDDYSYPLCMQCHAPLQSCTNCRRYQSDKCRRGFSAAEKDGKVLNQCIGFRAKKVYGADDYINISPYIWMTALLIVALSGLFYAAMKFSNDYKLPERTWTSRSIYPRAAIPTQISAEHESIIYINLQNAGDKSSERIFFRMPSSVFDHFDYYSITPEPEVTRKDKNGDLVLAYNPVESGSELALTLIFVPLYDTDIDFVCEILSPMAVSRAVISERMMKK